MSNYKTQLLDQLINSGWELVKILPSCDWWAEAHWQIRSIKQNWGLEIFIHFRYAPLGFSGLGKHKVVLDIEASSAFLNDNYLNSDTIATMYLQKGKFAEQMEQFVLGVNAFRDKVWVFMKHIEKKLRTPMKIHLITPKKWDARSSYYWALFKYKVLAKIRFVNLQFI